jgi:BirA family biotin operon repressor/biotin-[acetyl-CoA-carboxylase] ligase
MPLTTEGIEAHLETRWLGRSLTLIAATDSTNDDASAAAAAGAASGHTVVADHQRRGRGTHGREWSSPPGTDLYFSFVWRETLPATVRPVTTLAIGVALADLADEIGSPAAVQVKWPNDLWLGRAKCAGVLVETQTAGSRTGPLVAGVGLNVNRIDFPAELTTTATSLAREVGEVLDRELVLARALRHIEAWLDRLAASGPAPVIAALSRRLALVGERVEVADIEGVLVGVALSGALRIDTGGGRGVVELMTGTVTQRA